MIYLLFIAINFINNQTKVIFDSPKKSLLMYQDNTQQSQIQGEYEVDVLLQAISTEKGLYYKTKILGQSFHDAICLPISQLPISKRDYFHQMSKLKFPQQRHYKASEMKLFINTKHKLQNHFKNGDMVTKIIKCNQNGQSYLVQWNHDLLGQIKREYLEQYHKDMLLKFSMKKFLLFGSN